MRNLIEKILKAINDIEPKTKQEALDKGEVIMLIYKTFESEEKYKNNYKDDLDKTLELDPIWK